jgi:hypothetical protein
VGGPLPGNGIGKIWETADGAAVSLLMERLSDIFPGNKVVPTLFVRRPSRIKVQKLHGTQVLLRMKK